MKTPNLNRAHVRKLLNAALITDADFDAFCLDYFPNVKRRFGAAMQRVEKVNLLLEVEGDLERIADALREMTAAESMLANLARSVIPIPQLGKLNNRYGIVLGMVVVIGVMFGMAGYRFGRKTDSLHPGGNPVIQGTVPESNTASTLTGGDSKRGETMFAGVWRAGSNDDHIWKSDAAGFMAKCLELHAKNFRLVDLQVSSDEQPTQWVGIWQPGSDKQVLWFGVDWNSFKKKSEELSAQNLRLIDLEVYTEWGVTKYAGVWRAGSDRHALLAGLDHFSFQAKWVELSAQNLRLIDLEIYKENGETMFAGVFRAGHDQYGALMGLDWNAIKTASEAMSAQGLRLTDIEAYPDGDGTKYAGVWRSGGGAQYLSGNLNWENFQVKKRQLELQGFHLARILTYP